MKTTGKKQRQGLTLVELIVVLVILIGLAGIIIPMLSNMLGRTHTATAAVNCKEIAKWVQTYEQLYFKLPSGFDALTDGTTGGAICDYVPGNVGGHLTAADLTVAQATALTNAGIADVHAMVATQATFAADNTATFNPYVDTTSPFAPTAVASGISLPFLNLAGKENLGLSTTGEYVVLGLGKRSNMVGKMVSDPPVHFSDDPDKGPADAYGRFGLIFKVGDTAPGTVVNRAFLVAIAAFHDDGLATANHDLEEYYNIVKSTK